MAKILLVEDDSNLCYVLKACLAVDRHIVDTAGRGSDGLVALQYTAYDMAILDWSLPDISGIEICRQYRSRGGHIPILMLTGKAQPGEKATGLDAGADDYLVKPFDQTELLARVRALLRRPPSVQRQVLHAGDLELDTRACQVTRAGEKVELTLKEIAILELLMKHPNEYFTSDAILQRLWPADAASSSDTVRTHIKTLRRKLGDSDDAPLIVSTRNLGYRLVSDKSSQAVK
jgi:DNA-binding response OmpR family regulator